MDMKMPVVGSVSQGGSAAAVPAASSAISMQARAMITQIAADSALSPTERGGLVAAVAAFDQAVVSKSMREVLFNQVEGLGTYLRNTSTTTWPRWQQLTALRVYGLNVDHGAKSGMEEAVASAQRQMEAVAQASRSVSMAAVRYTPPAIEAARPAVVAAAVAPAPKVEVKVDAPKVAAVKVDKLV